MTSKEAQTSADRIPNGTWVIIDGDVMLKLTGQYQGHSARVIGKRGDYYKLRDENGFEYRVHEYDVTKPQSAQVDIYEACIRAAESCKCDRCASNRYYSKAPPSSSDASK